MDCRGNPMWLPKAGTRACPYLNIPGQTKFGRFLIEATIYTAGKNGFQKFVTAKKSSVEYFDLKKIKLPLRIRLRRAGDRFAPLGLGGEKKIGKFLTAQRVPHEVRKKVVLVEDRGKIIWLWPVRISEQAKVTTDTKQILRMKIAESDAE